MKNSSKRAIQVTKDVPEALPPYYVSDWAQLPGLSTDDPVHDADSVERSQDRLKRKPQLRRVRDVLKKARSH
jgi:hypothetical protein